MANDLNRLVDDTLIAGLPPGLKDAIDRLLARGMSRLSILTAVRAMAAKAAGGDPNKGRLTVAAVEAYLDAAT
jgi:hypothetical protein